MGVKLSSLSEWNSLFDENMNPLIVPDGRGKATKITSQMVRAVVERAKEIKAKGGRIRLKSFTRQLGEEKNIVLSSKKVEEILTANNLYKPQMRKRRPLFYQRLRQSIPNGLLSVDGSEFTVWIDGTPYKFNLELSVDVESYCHTAFSVSESETSEEFIKVMEAHKASWGSPLGIVGDHGSANLSDESKYYLKQNDIEILPAGPANPKGNGTCEGAFSEMKGVIGTIELQGRSPRELARAILEKIISVYIAMRNRLARLGDKTAPEATIKAPISAEEREQERKRIKKRKQKEVDPTRQSKLERLDWIIRHNGLKVDEQSLKRGQKCIVTYDLDAISRSEDAFLKALRRDQQRRTIPYFFGILNNIQNQMDADKHEEYCRRRYNYQQILEMERQKEEQTKESATVEDLAAMLKTAVLLRFRYLKDTCIRQARRMATNLKKQYNYVGALKKKILDALGKLTELSLEQRKEAIELMEEVLT